MLGIDTQKSQRQRPCENLKIEAKLAATYYSHDYFDPSEMKLCIGNSTVIAPPSTNLVRRNSVFLPLLRFLVFNGAWITIEHGKAAERVSNLSWRIVQIKD